MNRIFILLLTFLFSWQASAQIGGQNMLRMNSLLIQYGDNNNPIINYDAKYGLAEQKLLEYTDRYTISNIETIAVKKIDAGFGVELQCDITNPCIAHIDPQFNSTYNSFVLYIFLDEDAANLFASLAGEIIQEDFKKAVVIKFTKEPIRSAADKVDITELSTKEKELESKEPVLSAEKKDTDNFLSVSEYSTKKDRDANKILNPFGKELQAILALAENNELNKIAGAKVEGAFVSRIKLPQAKKNYINTYKGADCFIAEFDTKKQYDDLINLYDDILLELEDALPMAYEPSDMSHEEIYENSNDEVFHTEFYHDEDRTKPSIVIKITPDGKKNTLFLRIGKR